MDQNKNNSSIKDFVIRTIIVVLACCVVILFYNFVQGGSTLSTFMSSTSKILQSITVGVILAFLMNPIMVTIERWILPFCKKLYKKELMAKRAARTVSSVTALIIVLSLLTIFFVVIIPQLISTLQYLLSNIGEQVIAALDNFNSLTSYRYEDEIEDIKESSLIDVFTMIVNYLQRNTDIASSENLIAFAGGVYGYFKAILNVFVGIFISIYALSSKELFKAQAKKIIYSYFSVDIANAIVDTTRKASSIFYGFIIGKIIDSFIIGVICYVGMRIFNFPYALMVSMIIGVTNIIPVFGPFIGAIPSAIIIFLTDPKEGLYFVIFALALQQLDGNIIGPKILGESTGLSSFWVVVAITVGGGLFGIPGMLIGVPCVALIYYIISRYVGYRLRLRGLPEHTLNYHNLKRIDGTTKDPEYHDEDYLKNRRITTIFSKKAPQPAEQETAQEAQDGQN